MAYNETTVLMGGLVHVPIVIGVLNYVDSITKRRYNAQKTLLENEARAAAAAVF